MNGEATAGDGPTIIEPDTSSRILFWIGFPIAGAVLGWLVKSIAGWAASLPWVPLQAPLELIASLPEPHATLGCLALGVLGGLVVAFVAEHEYVKLAIAADSVVVGVGDTRRTVERADTSAVFFEGKELIVLGRRAEELVRAKADYGTAEGKQVAAAFHRHGWPWSESGDPYAGEYRRWVDDTPDLSGAANAVLRARAKALDKDDKDDAAQLRDELAKLGIVVRDEQKRQFWRRTTAEPG